MGLFKKNANEAAYVGGKKHFADVIKNTAPGDFLVWRQPEEDFNNGSTLIVMPGEEAVFIKGGVIEQVFSNGTYILSTENYPFISRWRNARTGGVSTFNCVVYFVKKALSVEVKWGTDSKIQVRDNVLLVPTKVGANGSYKISVENPGVFITKLLGNNIAFQHPQDLDNYFFSEFQSKIKTVIGKALKNRKEELLGISADLEDLSNEIKPFFQETLSEYGLKCQSFVVSNIEIDEDPLRNKREEIDQEMYAQSRQGDVIAANTVKQGKAEDEVEKMRRQTDLDFKYRQALIDVQIMLAQGKAEKEIMDYFGESGWSKREAAEILKTFASNPGGGGLATAGANLAVGMAMGGPLSNLANQMIEPMMNDSISAVAPDLSSASRFGEQVEVPAEDPMKVLGKLKELLDAGLITEDEYIQKKKEVLSRM